MQKQKPSKSGHICVGVILGAHGIRGQLRVKSFCENPEDIAVYPFIITNADKNYTPTKAQIAPKNTVRLTVKEITDRTTAEALKGMPLFIKKEVVDLAEDEILYQDLLGRPVYFQETEIGTLADIFSNGAHDILDIKMPEKSILIPFQDEFALLEAEKITLTPAAEDFLNL